jgi:preprotein translocase subunit YajC
VSSSYIPLIVFAVVVIGLLAFSARARRRQATAVAERAERIRVGTEVMTTSGLYGTVVSMLDGDKVMMSIAPGVEVKWALAALRDIESLPMEYQDQTGAAAEGVSLDKRTDADPAA